MASVSALPVTKSSEVAARIAWLHYASSGHVGVAIAFFAER
jgi:hypothetical protein